MNKLMMWISFAFVVVSMFVCAWDMDRKSAKREDDDNE